MSKALKVAIEANDPAATLKALKTVKDLSRKLPKGDVPLVHACKVGADAVIEVLLEAGAPLHRKSDYEGDHPLAVAAEHGHAQVVARLAARGVPSEVVAHALFSAVLDGREAVVEALLESCKPAIAQRTLEVSTWWKDGRIFKLLVQHGADVNAANDDAQSAQQKGQTPLHDAAGAGRVESIRMLAQNGAQVNALDAMGTSALMHLAAAMPRLDQDQRIAQEQAGRELTAEQKALQEKIAAQTRRHGDRAPANGMAAARLLLELAADAARTDRFGNDARMYYEWARRHDREEPNEDFRALLEQAGSRGIGPTADLFWAIAADDAAAVRRAIQAGANVNHQAPPPDGYTPLLMARSAAVVEILLAAGADPNKPSLDALPLISAAGSGELDIVQLLVKAGADIHAIEPHSSESEYVANAYSAARMNAKHEVVEYLKSVGAGNPVREDWKPLEPGVGIWENFSEVIVQGTVSQVATALAKLIGGAVQENVYDKELLPGQHAFAVLRPKGMAWCNVLQVAPPTGFFDTDVEFLRRLSRASGLPIILAQYSDASGAASVERFEPDGSSQIDEGWDQDTLEEMVGELGNQAPAWMKERLAAMEESGTEPPDSSQRLSELASKEKFVVAWGGLHVEPGRAVEISFTNLPAAAFDGVAWVSDQVGPG